MTEITVYLAGPINGCTDKECIEWREKVKQDLKDKYVFLDPMVRDYRDPDVANRNYIDIVEKDKNDILQSDIILLNAWKTSVGTSMECLFAYQEGKGIIIKCDDKTVLSPWFRYHTDFVVETWEEAYEKIDIISQEIRRMEEELTILEVDEQLI